METRITAPYGSWRSPLSAELVASGGVGLGGVALADGAIYWAESRPLEGGRVVVVSCDAAGQTQDVTPPGFNARTRVHEYGGGAYWTHHRTVFFSNFGDSRLYRQDGSDDPRPITPEPPAEHALRYADGTMSPDGLLIVCVRERHQEGREAINELVALPADGSAAPRVIVSGSDFYSFPRISPDGYKLTWTCWDHPRMPWDGAELWVADLDAQGTPGAARLVAGGPAESIFQPAWSPQGVLHFVSDRTGWWNLYRERAGAVEALTTLRAEFGRPQWVFNQSTYAFLSDGRIGCSYTQDGADHLAILAADGGQPKEVAGDYTAFSGLRSDGQKLYCVAASPTRSAALMAFDPATGAAEALRLARQTAVDPAYLAAPRAIEYPTGEGQIAHALYYPPANSAYTGPPDQRPPLLVMGHGGPTSMASATLDLERLYWTSRGIAVVDVNYRGSTGYGRAYRAALDGQWGVADTEDCLNAARYLVGQDLVDPRRLAIRGGSAGGYTTLCALTFHDLFAVGASYYGVADAEALAAETHKFESRYCDRLIGPYPAAREVYLARSPIHHTDQLACPMILFQGLDDRVVPPAQAEQMVAALRAKGLPFAYIAFEGEGHGFRQAANQRRALEAELYFYAHILNFPLADPIEPVTIENL